MKNKSLKSKVLIVVVLAMLSFINSASLYESSKSNIINLNPKNFDTQITQNRAKNTVSFVHFYTANDSKSKSYKNEISQMAVDYDGMFKFAAIDCKEFSDLCNKQDVREFPAFRIYPPLPAPVFPYEQEIEGKKIISALGKFVDNKTVDVHSNNVDSFLEDDSNIPKVLLFTDKEGVPLIYKVLAVQFDKKLKFGVTRKSESSIISKYKITKYPRIMVIPVGAKKPIFFEGENKFKLIFDFLNVYSETFFKVGEDKTKASEVTKADKPWLNEKFPELHNLSGNELCFKVDGIICVILINNGKPDSKVTELMAELQNYLNPKIDRGIKYKFGWINSETQTKFTESIEVTKVPQIVLINPGKRKRFYVAEEDLEISVLSHLFEKLASGDLRFKMFPGNEIHELAEASS